MEDLITIRHGGSVLLAITPGGNVVLPLDANQRSIAYAALCDAFALLCDVKLPRSIAAMEAVQEERGQEIERGHDARTADADAPPLEPQDTGNIVTFRRSLDLPLADH